MMDKEHFMRTALRTPKYWGAPTPIVPFAGWDFYYISADLLWTPDSSTDISVANIRVPKGFVTDLASIPRIFWSLLPPTATYAYPAIIHDYLYWTQPCDRAEADRILKIAMRELKVSSSRVHVIYTAVRSVGWLAWSTNEAAKRKGERRILLKFPSRIDTTWADWKNQRDAFCD